MYLCMYHEFEHFHQLADTNPPTNFCLFSEADEGLPCKWLKVCCQSHKSPAHSKVRNLGWPSISRPNYRQRAEHGHICGRYRQKHRLHMTTLKWLCRANELLGSVVPSVSTIPVHYRAGLALARAQPWAGAGGVGLQGSSGGKGRKSKRWARAALGLFLNWSCAALPEEN